MMHTGRGPWVQLRGLRLPDGTYVENLQELAERLQGSREIEEAVWQHYNEGELEKWLRRAGHDKLADDLKRLRQKPQDKTGVMQELLGRFQTTSRVRRELEEASHKPDKLIDFFKKRNFSKELAADAGVKEKHTVERHTLMVLRQFEKYFSRRPLPGGFATNTFRVILALHDIGVSKAIEEGTRLGMSTHQAKKAGQAKYTHELMGAEMEALGFTNKEISCARALVSDDPIGSYLKSGILSTASIFRMASESEMPVPDFFELLLVFFMVDAGSYTQDAGGIKSLDFLFVFHKHEKTMTFSPETSNKIDALRTSLALE